MASLDLLQSARKEFAYYPSLGDKTFAQLSDADLFRVPLYSATAPGNDSIAVIVKHMHCNMLSRWTDFLSTDGEKPWRQRDAEFVNDTTTREELLTRWNEGWTCLFNASDPLTPADLERTVLIRIEPHTVQQAIVRQLAPLPYGADRAAGQVVPGRRLPIPVHPQRRFTDLQCEKGVVILGRARGGGRPCSKLMGGGPGNRTTNRPARQSIRCQPMHPTTSLAAIPVGRSSRSVPPNVRPVLLVTAQTLFIDDLRTVHAALVQRPLRPCL